MTGLTLALLLSTSAHPLEQDAVPESTSRTEQELLEAADQHIFRRRLRAWRCRPAERSLLHEFSRGPTTDDARRLAQCFSRKQRHTRAGVWAERAAELELDPHQRLKHRANQLLHTWRAGAPMGAARLARDIESQDPLHPRYLLVRARIALESGRPEDAQAWLMCLSGPQRRDWTVHLLEAELALEQDDLLGLEHHAQVVLNRRPGHPHARALLAESLRRSGAPEAARAALDSPKPPGHRWPLWEAVSALVSRDLDSPDPLPQPDLQPRVLGAPNDGTGHRLRSP